jgi:hypothetical protein
MYITNYLLALAFLTITITSCSDADPKTGKYEILKEEKNETSGKAQLVEYAVYKDSTYTKEALEEVIMDIYKANHEKNVFEEHDAPTVFGIYLYTSPRAAEDKAEWIAMLTQTPGHPTPDITYNDFKIVALSGLNDNVKSDAEIEVDKLNTYLKERGLELCSLSELLKKNYADNIHQADAKYPDFGEKHQEMIDTLNAQFKRELCQKYNMNEDMLANVYTYAPGYCK